MRNQTHISFTNDGAFARVDTCGKAYYIERKEPGRYAVNVSASRGGDVRLGYFSPEPSVWEWCLFRPEPLIVAALASACRTLAEITALQPSDPRDL